MTKYHRAYDRSTVVLSYKPDEAEALRELAASITLSGGTSPSLSLLSRRALQMYCAHIVRHQAHYPAAYAAEVSALESLTAKRASPKRIP